MALAARIGAILDAGEFPVVRAATARSCSGRVWQCTCWRVGGRPDRAGVRRGTPTSASGQRVVRSARRPVMDLALVPGRGQGDLAALEGGGRTSATSTSWCSASGRRTNTGSTCRRRHLHTAVPSLRAEGAARTAQWATHEIATCAGFWVHVDVDVPRPGRHAAVDAPDPAASRSRSWRSCWPVSWRRALPGRGADVFDPDYDRTAITPRDRRRRRGRLAPVGATAAPVHPREHRRERAARRADAAHRRPCRGPVLVEPPPPDDAGRRAPGRPAGRSRAWWPTRTRPRPPPAPVRRAGRWTTRWAVWPAPRWPAPRRGGR